MSAPQAIIERVTFTVILNGETREYDPWKMYQELYLRPPTLDVIWKEMMDESSDIADRLERQEEFFERMCSSLGTEAMHEVDGKLVGITIDEAHMILKAYLAFMEEIKKKVPGWLGMWLVTGRRSSGSLETGSDSSSPSTTSESSSDKECPTT